MAYTGRGIAGYVYTGTGLTSSAQFLPATAGSITITGDVGSISGTSLTIFANTASLNCGSSVSFNNTSTTSTFNVTDSGGNTIIGLNSGNSSVAVNASGNVGLGLGVFPSLTSGNSNFGAGYNALFSITSGSNNTAGGYGALGNITSGIYNTAFGQLAGIAYTGAESSNILIQNTGILGESNVTRIGQTGSGVGSQNLFYAGGITGSTPTSANIPQVVLCDNTDNVTVIPSGTANFVLTSNGSTSTPSFQALPDSSITISGDIGSIAGNSLTIYANNTIQGCGSSVLFSNSGTTSTFQVTDSNNNTLIGNSAGNSSISGSGNTGIGTASLNLLSSASGNSAFGFGSLTAISTGGENTAIGTSALASLLTGTSNVALGEAAGISYSGSESNNISINNPGVLGESGVTRIGTNGLQTLCYITGINETAPTSVNFPQIVLADNDDNIASLTSGVDGVLITDDTGLISWLANSGTPGYVLTANSSAPPSWQPGGGMGSGIATIDGDTSFITGTTVTLSGSTTGLTFTGDGATSMTLGGTLIVGNGGTGATTLLGVLLGNGTSPFTSVTGADNGVLITSNSGVVSWLANSGTAGYVLTANTGAPPSWQVTAASSISLTGDSGGALTGDAFTITGGSTGLTFAGASTTLTLGGTLVVANGGSGASTLTGVLTGNGTSPFTVSAVTTHAVLVGAASNLIASVGPTATAGQILQSAGSSANPAFSTATYPSSTTVSQLLYSSSANVVAGLSTVDDGVLVSTNTGVPVWLANSGTAGYVLTANTAAPPSWQEVSAPVGITSWVDVTSSTQSMAVNTGYTSNDGGTLVTFTLPSTAAYGTQISVVGKASGLWKIVENSGQTIHYSGSSTTTTTGYLESNTQYAAVTLLCTIANTDFTVLSSTGNLDVV